MTAPREISIKTISYTRLVAGGYSPKEAEELTAHMSNRNSLGDVIEDGDLVDELIAGRKLKIAETLSIYWLVEHLRVLATQSEDRSVAVKALGLLVDLHFSSCSSMR